MDITPQTLDAIFYSFGLQFQTAYQAQDTWFERLCTPVPSTGRENRYGWLDKLPAMREWVGERQIQNAIAQGYSIVNKDWELTVEVERNDIEDDQLGVYAPIVAQMGSQAKLWPDYLTADAMQAGKTTICFDGQAFFNASHPRNTTDSGAGTYSNLLTSTALTPTNYAAARSTMMSYVGRDGKTLNVKPNLLIVPPQLEQVGLQILHADFIAPAAALGGNAANVVQTNPLKGSANLLVVPQLTNEPAAWYLADTTKPIKALVFQKRKDPQLIPQVNPNDPEVFRRKKYVYGVDSRGNVGFSLPFLMLRGEG